MLLLLPSPEQLRTSSEPRVLLKSCERDWLKDHYPFLKANMVYQGSSNDPFWENQTIQKYVILTDFPYDNALFGLVHHHRCSKNGLLKPTKCTV